MKNQNDIVRDSNNSESKKLELKVYTKPEIIKLGAIQKITLLSSVIGTGDSGNVTTYYP